MVANLGCDGEANCRRMKKGWPFVGNGQPRWFLLADGTIRNRQRRSRRRQRQPQRRSRRP